MIAAGQTAPAPGARFLPDSTRPIDIARSLLDHGADVNAKSKGAFTALMVAATHNNPPMIGLLLQAGANASVKNAQGQTALDVAEINGNHEAAQAISVLSTAIAASAKQEQPQNGQGTTSQ
jgi:ankyrin repeat protein